MARPGSNTTLYSPASMTTGTATALRNAWAAAGAALGNWTVGAMYTFGAGTSERNFWVLSAGNVEILCTLNNGTLYHHQSVYSGYYDSSYNIQRALYLAFARQGGFASALASGFDPLNQNFWDDITVTQGLHQPSPMQACREVYTGNTNPKFYLLCDDTSNMCMILVGDRDGYDHYTAHIFADDLYENDSLYVSDQLYPEGYAEVIIGGATNPTLPIVYMAFWEIDRDGLCTFDTTITEIQNPCNNIPAGGMTLADHIPTGSYLVITPQKTYAKVNSNYLRSDPYNNPIAWKGIVGTDANYQWTRMYRYVLLPWEAGLAAPT